jgi:hypothetical protein
LSTIVNATFRGHPTSVTTITAELPMQWRCPLGEYASLEPSHGTRLLR